MIQDDETKFFSELFRMRDKLTFFKQWKRTGSKSKWTCKDGSQIRICDMSDAHLNNTIRLLERKQVSGEALRYMKIERKYRDELDSLKRNIARYEEIEIII